ncbi:hypothetical protein F511_47705 [Dorcoceras hygrometricum]|uniref:Uncharacterized protein n=1 Tax=Dorcoceras hygrometricum TaxID=472368 RepID=A0A2Z6ZXI8_9LAMI|nr:hypothetical protein F511_47705 [Dorcoceras hygrometricum]
MVHASPVGCAIMREGGAPLTAACAASARRTGARLRATVGHQGRNNLRKIASHRAANRHEIAQLRAHDRAWMRGPPRMAAAGDFNSMF